MATIGMSVETQGTLDPIIHFDGAKQQAALERIRQAVLRLDTTALPTQIQALLDHPLKLGQAVERTYVLGQFDWPFEVVQAMGDYTRSGTSLYKLRWLSPDVYERQLEIRQEARKLVNDISG